MKESLCRFPNIPYNLCILVSPHEISSWKQKKRVDRELQVEIENYKD